MDEIPKIEVTTDYSMFSFFEENRDLEKTKKHLDSLTKAIEANNRLHLHPILVTSDFKVLDGQHRLKAAEKLGVPIYYIVDEKGKSEDIATDNSLSKNWTLQDFFEFYAKRGDKRFEKVFELYKEIKLPWGIFAAFCNISARGDIIRSGNFESIEIEKIKDLIEKWKEIVFIINEHSMPSSVSRKVVHMMKFIRAFCTFLERDDVDFKILKRKILMGLNLLIPYGRSEQLANVLKQIYNYKSRDPIP